MAIPKRVSRCTVYPEFSTEVQNEWFSVKEKKVISDYDNFYYTVHLFEDRCEEEIKSLIEDLKKCREAFDFKSDRVVDFMGLDYYPFGLKMYNNKLSKPECFDVLVCESLPNEKTPRIMVQLRARYLWLFGFKNCFTESFEKVKQILMGYDIDVKKVVENRIDYAFHTNSIQNFEAYFDRNLLVESCATNARIYNHVGDPNRDWSIDYLSIGSRSAKSVFFRAYNKTREVVEQAYKSFFLQVWRENELISAYDQYCIEVAYQRKSYDVGLLIGRIQWYLQYGADDRIKESLRELHKKCYADSSNSSEIRKQIDGLLPGVTTICNIEFETHKDFYRTFDKSLLELPGGLTELDTYTERVFQIYDCRRSFVDYLTSFDGSVAFMDNVADVRAEIKAARKRKEFYKKIDGKRTFQSDLFEVWKKKFVAEHYADFWKRIRACRLGTDYMPEIYREYERNVDVEKIKRRICADVALLSIHRHGPNESFDLNADMSDFYSVLNDNDMHFIGAVDSNGECVEIKYGDYYTVKQRKNRQYESIVQAPPREDN